MLITMMILSPEALETMLEQELDLTTQCLMNNPKSYGAWHHRAYCMRMFKVNISINNHYVSNYVVKTCVIRVSGA